MLKELKLSKIAIVLVVLLLIAINSYGQTEVQIPASMDNTLFEDATGALSNGAGTHIFVGRTGQNENSIRRGLIAFDIVGSIPANANIQSVMLTLNMSKTKYDSVDISLHKVLAQWGEGTSDASRGGGAGDSSTTSDATWIHRLYDTELWSTPGGDFVSLASATLPVDGVGSYAWGSPEQLVADVQSWLDNPMGNFGWILIGDESAMRTAKRFDSRENATESNRPVLTVTYTTTQQTAMIDRFSMAAGHLFIRDESNGLPGPNEPIDFDMEPFITKGLGPNGEFISYYNFDVQSTEPAPIYVLFKEGEDVPVAGQMNIIDVIPGDEGYNDFWEVQKVTVPTDYVANTVTSFSQIMDAGYTIEETTILVNCPVVPEGSTAKLRLGGESPELTKGWYKGTIVYYFNFLEKELMVDESDMVPLSPIYVTFNINPDQPGGGPGSGFVTDENGRTHNVTSTLPMDEGYSPLWMVNVYDNADFPDVFNLLSAHSATILATGVATANCPIVSQAVNIDRFSMEAGHLFIRDSSNALPGPNEPIDFDVEPFITKGLGPLGKFISYYNFDVQPTEPVPIYVLFCAGEATPVEGQHNIIDVIPGDEGYNDFWEVQKVTVPAGYVANTVTSFSQIMDAGYSIEETTTLVNCPVVPEGSTAKLRLGGESPELTKGWYKGMIVYYFNFLEKELMVDESDMVPQSPIYVAFNINPDQPDGGPASGFMTDPVTGRTHNVTSTLPMDDDYSPLWWVNVYDNADWENVHDLASAEAANILAMGVATVNCPIVQLGNATSVDDENSTTPLTYNLDQNYPNPFNPSTEIQFSVPNRGLVTLCVYNILGKQVAELMNENLKPGNYSVYWDARDQASGLYFYTLKAGSYKATKKMMLLK